MCGRYALGIRASFVRHQLQQQGLPVDEAPDDDEARETYNFPPGAYGLVYRADVPDQGVRDEAEAEVEAQDDAEGERHVDHNDDTSTSTGLTTPDKKYKYQIKVMKWGLIPFWTKRSPDYSSMLRTINCRDDSLAEPRGMWNTMKQRKRCIVVAQGFYEWLKKGPNSKDKIPHFVKRKDGNLMCFAGLWDCVRYEEEGGNEDDNNNNKKKEGSKEKLYTYTIITTDSNKQLSFLHDRMPVILDPNTDEMKLWLNPAKNKWSKELQAILRPFDGELECYPVDKDVGKVGNNSASFIVPVDSKENKKNIANFFGNAANKLQKTKTTTKTTTVADPGEETKVKKEAGEVRDTVDHNGREDNAPLPVPKNQDSVGASVGDKRSAQDEDDDDQDLKSGRDQHSVKQIKLSTSPSPSPAKSFSPTKLSTAKKPRSAISNKDNTLKTSPSKKQEPGTQRITNFFTK
ncbi:hypothetical protein B0A52_04803 [Exophiala mesophila]|uniref:DUF159 domain protein n=1 Tax=Exophiala mesophila TaxID=212818 RepID=A0A438N630_EXOME|nr:hypothetical protein B0A52_04803 [Exophiala mesophila]